MPIYDEDQILLAQPPQLIPVSNAGQPRVSTPVMAPPTMPIQVQPQGQVPVGQMAPPMMPMYQPQQADYPQDIKDTVLQNMRQEMADAVQAKRGAKVKQLGQDLQGMVGPAIAAFGGAGASAGGVALMQQAKQDAAAARAHADSQATQHANAIKDWVSMYNTVGLKPIQNANRAIADQAKEQRLMTKQQQQQQNFDKTLDWKNRSLQGLTDYRNGTLSFKKLAEQHKEAYHGGLLGLKARGLDLKDEEIDNQVKYHDEVLKLGYENARIKMVGINNQNRQAYETNNIRKAALQAKIGMFDSKLHAQLSRVDSLGNPVYTDPSGKALDPNDFILDFSAPQAKEPTPDQLMAEFQPQQPQEQVQGQVMQPQPQQGQPMQPQAPQQGDRFMPGQMQPPPGAMQVIPPPGVGQPIKQGKPVFKPPPPPNTMPSYAQLLQTNPQQAKMVQQAFRQNLDAQIANGVKTEDVKAKWLKSAQARGLQPKDALEDYYRMGGH